MRRKGKKTRCCMCIHPSSSQYLGPWSPFLTLRPVYTVVAHYKDCFRRDHATETAVDLLVPPPIAIPFLAFLPIVVRKARLALGIFDWKSLFPGAGWAIWTWLTPLYHPSSSTIKAGPNHYPPTFRSHGALRPPIAGSPATGGGRACQLSSVVSVW